MERLTQKHFLLQIGPFGILYPITYRFKKFHTEGAGLDLYNKYTTSIISINDEVYN